MKNILFPTDFSENANNALNYALAIASIFDANLHIINAYQMPYASSAPMTRKLLDTLKDSSQKELDEYKNKILQKESNKALSIIINSIAGDVINVVDDYSNENNIDLVVMGTKGASGIKEVLIGSNAEEVVKHSDKSVLIVPEKANAFSITKVAFAADFQNIENEKLIDPYLSFIQKFEAETLLINIENDEDKIYSSKKTFEAKRLEDIFADVKHSFHFEVDQDVVNGINKFIERNNCDMLAVISRKHNMFEKIFHKSVTNKLTCHTELPMFVIKER